MGVGFLTKIRILKTFSYFLIFASFLMGLFTFHGREILSSLQWFRGDLGDARMVALYREHAYQYVFHQGSYYASSLLNTPWGFYPHSRIFFFTDTMLGDLWSYAMFRGMGLSPLPAQTACVILSSVLMYGLSLFIFLKQLRVHPFVAAACAYLICFNLPRTVMQMHPQMMGGFPTVAFLAALLAFWEHRNNKGSARIFVMVMAFCLGWQFWSSHYLGFFLLMSLIMAGFMIALNTDRRKVALSLIVAHKASLVMGAVICLLLLAPYLYFYLEAMSEVGGRSTSEVSSGLPQITSYFAVPPESVYWSSMNWVWRYVKPGRAPEWHMFAGFVPVLSLVMAVYFRKQLNKTAYFALLVFLGLFFWTFASKTGYSLWMVTLPVFPGASSIRCMCRLALFLVIPASVVMADLFRFFTQSFGAPVRGVLAGVLLLAVMIENRSDFSYGTLVSAHEERVNPMLEKLAQLKLSRKCRSFVMERDHSASSEFFENDGMWISLLSQTPTVHGYSGFQPVGWDIYRDRVLDLKALEKWFAQRDLKFDPISEDCVL